MPPTNDQFSRLLDEARRVPATERQQWVATLPVDAELKERLNRALNEGLTIDLRAPTGASPDIQIAPTRGATLSDRAAAATGATGATGGPAGGSPTGAQTGGQASAPRVRPGPAIDPLIGRTFAGVAIERVLGSGGMGRVYLGTDGSSGKSVALKVLLRTQRDENVRRRFDREARVLQRLRHPCIASVLRTGVEEDGDVDIPYIVMEHVEGALPITDYVFKQRLGMRDICQLYLQVCDAVGHAHTEGFLHRDLKPGNILVNRQGRVKVIDFGVARAVQVDSAAVTVRTETGQLVGTMQYMSPEQFKADPRLIDKRSDVYALSSVLYELLTGIQPHDLRSLPVHEAARIVCQTDPPDVRQCNPHVDAALAQLLANGLSREAAHRPVDAQHMGRSLKAWLSTPTPTIEATIHPVHPDKEFVKVGGHPDTTAEHAPRPRDPLLLRPRGSTRSNARGGWGMIGFVTSLLVVAVLIAFDVIPAKGLVERVRKLTSAVSAATAAAPADPEPPPTKGKGSKGSSGKGGAKSGTANAGAQKSQVTPVVETTSVEQVRVVAAPAGAAISVNGESKGLAPALVLAQMNSRGSVQIQASMEGWKTAEATWQVKDGPLVAFNLVPLEEQDSMERVFVLDTADVGKGCTLQVTAPAQQDVAQRMVPVVVGFKRVDGKWQSAAIVLEATDPQGQPAEIQVGARRGKGTVSYDVLPEECANRLRVRVR